MTTPNPYNPTPTPDTPPIEQPPVPVAEPQPPQRAGWLAQILLRDVFDPLSPVTEADVSDYKVDPERNTRIWRNSVLTAYLATLLPGTIASNPLGAPIVRNLGFRSRSAMIRTYLRYGPAFGGLSGAVGTAVADALTDVDDVLQVANYVYQLFTSDDTVEVPIPDLQDPQQLADFEDFCSLLDELSELDDTSIQVLSDLCDRTLDDQMTGDAVDEVSRSWLDYVYPPRDTDDPPTEPEVELPVWSYLFPAQPIIPDEESEERNNIFRRKFLDMMILDYMRRYGTPVAPLDERG